MNRQAFLRTLGACALALALPARADDNVVVIANAPLRGIDPEVIRRIYTGRTIEIDGQALRPVNLPAGNGLRRRFLDSLLQQGDDDYVAYWTVRRYIGKGTPPRELADAAEVVEFVRRTPGAVGYVDMADLKPGMHVLLKR